MKLLIVIFALIILFSCGGSTSDPISKPLYHPDTWQANSLPTHQWYKDVQTCGDGICDSCHSGYHNDWNVKYYDGQPRLLYLPKDYPSDPEVGKCSDCHYVRIIK